MASGLMDDLPPIDWILHAERLAEGRHSDELRWMVGRAAAVSERHGDHYIAYVGIPLEHRKAGRDFDDLNHDPTCPRVSEHEWSWSTAGEEGTFWPKGWWWYGWAYFHAWDLHPGLRPNYPPTQAKVIRHMQELLPIFQAWLELPEVWDDPQPSREPTDEERAMLMRWYERVMEAKGFTPPEDPR